jgi:hypothetical protein
MIRKFCRLLPVMGIIVLLISGCTMTTTGSYGGSNSTGSNNSGTGSNNSGTGSNNPGSSTEPNWGVQTKTSGCQASGGIEDKACTPGDIIQSATKEQICVSGYAGTVRNVPQSVKNEAYASYGIASHRSGEYEVDHLVSLELGGSNDISNLWPELASPKPGFHEKDKVENYLHKQMCSGAVTLKQAQIEIATDWLSVYNSMPASDKSGSGSNVGSA